MKEKTEATTAVAATAREQSQPDSTTKVSKEKDITKLVRHLSIYDSSTLTASIQTGILRCSICYYIGQLESMGLVGVVGRWADPTTHRIVKHYSCNPSHWHAPKWVQGELFPEQEGGLL